MTAIKTERNIVNSVGIGSRFFMKNKTYTIRFRKVNYDIFKAIVSGKKKVETRAATIRYKSIRPGDTIKLVCGKNRAQKTVKGVKIFKSIRGLLKKYRAQDINPKIKTGEELVKLYYSFPKYREKIKKYGIIAIEI